MASLPCLLYLAAWSAVQESPRWLLISGRKVTVLQLDPSAQQRSISGLHSTACHRCMRGVGPCSQEVTSLAHRLIVPEHRPSTAGALQRHTFTRR